MKRLIELVGGKTIPDEYKSMVSTTCFGPLLLRYEFFRLLSKYFLLFTLTNKP
jgi:hypothetical protein